MENNNKDSTKLDLKKLFNMNNILSQIINFAAYIILVLSSVVLIYLSFIEAFKIQIDWTTLTIFTGATVLLSWVNWNMFYKRQYEKLMADDIAQHDLQKYSIHSRYYNAIKDWTDSELQEKIDEFNDEYTAKWLRWVEKHTGYPIETKTEVVLDNEGHPVIDEVTGKPKLIVTPGIKDLPYKGFKHKGLMRRIKNHNYPQSGYKTSMELMSLFSFQESNLNRRDLTADKRFYTRHAFSKFISLLLILSLGASLIPEMVSGNYASAILKLVLALGGLFAAVFQGALNGVRGARLKLSIVEDTCADLERWAKKKPVLTPYKIAEANKQISTTEVKQNTNEVTLDIFNKHDLSKK